ncbi:RHS repeat-associated core domain-containing protein [Lysobacter sp. OAE881]|uniref:RHS repeat-associated core domain-containing protein n=1 Tax=Lysobacter sp. OAE881 TaxID=2663813 RepID=UPI00178A442C
MFAQLREYTMQGTGRMLMNRGRQWLAVLVLFLVGSTASAQTQFQLGGNGWMGLGNRNGDFFIVQDDLQVKVPGGYVRINRDFDGKQWVFNRQWSGLGRPSYNKAMYPSIGAFYSCTVVDGVSSCDTTASSGSSIQFGNPENEVQQTRIPNDPYFGRNADGSPASDPHADQFVARMGVGFTRSSDGTSWVSSKHPRFVLRPQQVPALPVSAGPDAHPSTGRPGKGGMATVQVNGFRWTDRSGAWIEYDNFGRITSYGDRNDVRVWMQYGSHGQVERVLDDNGRTVFTLLYTGGNADFISEVRDHTPFDGSIRRVKYQYDGDGRLRTVIDARGNPTSFDYGSLDSVAYDYDGGYGAPNTGGSGEPTNARATTTSAATGFVVDTRRKVTKVTDAEGRVTEISYGVTARVGRIKAPDGGVTDFDYGYDKLKKEFSITARYPQTDSGRRVETTYFDQEGRPSRRDVNGKVLMSTQGSWSSLSYIDERNNVTRIDRNNFDEVTRETNPDGSSVSISYEAASLDPKEIVDAAGVKTRMEYDGKGNLTRLIVAADTPDEQITEYEVNARGEPEVVRRKGGSRPDGGTDPDVVLALRYDANGNARELVDGEGKLWQYEYDAQGNLARAIDPLGHKWTYGYDADGNWLSSTDPNQRESRFEYDKTGRLKSVADARKATTALEYDSAGRPREVTDPTGAYERLSFDLAGRFKGSENASGQKVAFGFDAFDRLTMVTDGTGNITRLDYAEPDGTDRGGYLVTKVSYPTWQRLLYYNSRNWASRSVAVVDGTTRSTTSTYDERGLETSQTDPYEKVSGASYDALGRLLEATNELGDKVRYAYDRRDNLVSVTDELGHTRRLEYDRRNKLVKETSAAGEETEYRYDDAGRLAEVSRANGVRIALMFDPAGYLKTRKAFRPDGSLEQTHTFDWDAGNRLSAWATDNASATLTYDDAGRLLSETVTVRGVAMARHYTYHANGQLKTTSGPDGVVLAYSYDGNGDFERLEIPGEGSITVSGRHWTAPKSVVLPGGTVQEFELDGLLNQTRLRVRGPSQATLFDQSSVYGLRDEVIRRTTQSREITYEYDASLRLVEANPAGFGTAEKFVLDAASNRTSDQNVENTWQYDEANRLLERGPFSYEYDASGNLVRRVDGRVQEPRRTTHYAYDGYNRLVEVRNGAAEVLARYDYDPFGYRIRKEVTAAAAGQVPGIQAGVRVYLQAEEGLLAELDANGQVVRSFGWLPERPYGTLPTFMRSGGSYYYYHHDPTGMPRLLTDKDGQIVWQADSVSAFGEARPFAGAMIEQPWRLPGQYYDPETGLHYNLQRYYDPTIGRYISEDPLGLEGGLNHYVYASASPTVFMDPTGELPVLIIPVGAMARAAAAAYARCWAACMVQSSIVDYVTRGCVDLGENAKNCALECLNPLNWGRLRGPKIKPPRVKPPHIAPKAADDAAKKVVPSSKKPTGTYTNTHASGTKYHGKGTEDRMRQSAAEKAKEHNDPVVDSKHTPAASEREALKEEDRRIQADGGPGNNNYNKINSPGRKLREQDGD